MKCSPLSFLSIAALVLTGCSATQSTDNASSTSDHTEQAGAFNPKDAELIFSTVDQGQNPAALPAYAPFLESSGKIVAYDQDANKWLVQDTGNLGGGALAYTDDTLYFSEKSADYALSDSLKKFDRTDLSGVNALLAHGEGFTGLSNNTDTDDQGYLTAHILTNDGSKSTVTDAQSDFGSIVQCDSGVWGSTKPTQQKLEDAPTGDQAGVLSMMKTDAAFAQPSDVQGTLHTEKIEQNHLPKSDITCDGDTLYQLFSLYPADADLQVDALDNSGSSTSPQFEPTGTLLVSYDTKTHQAQQVPVSEGYVNNLGLVTTAVDEGKLWVVEKDGAVTSINLASGQLTHAFSLDQVAALEMHQGNGIIDDGKLIVFEAADSAQPSLSIYSLETGEKVNTQTLPSLADAGVKDFMVGDIVVPDVQKLVN